jgi:Asp-tRNA(Asn)/Glu-tRNA(Gln) amidotransferase C subunit
MTSSKVKWVFRPVNLRLAEADRQKTEKELEDFLKFIENLLEVLVSTKICSSDFM